MITAVIFIIAIYLAVRFTLSETSQKIYKFREIWRQAFPLTRVDDRAEDSCASGEHSTQSATESTHANSAKELKLARRRTGAVNGIKPHKPSFQRLSKRQLRLPFMDTGMFQGSQFTADVASGSPLESTDCKDKGPPLSLSNGEAFNCGVSNENIINMFKVPTEDRNQGAVARFFHHVSFFLQRKPPINYPDVSDKVLSSERVKSAVRTAVFEEFKGQNPDDTELLLAHLKHKQRAVTILQNMRSCISSFLLKVAAWVMYKLLGRILDGIEVHKEQIEMIKRTSQHNIPIIYLPLHRSHLDYILVTFILYMNDLRAPLVAAGNNLMIPFFGSLLRGLGAFFIKRKLDPQQGQRDYVYRAILHTYMEKSLRDGHSLEFFIEGGRSRTGKAVLPKAGLLSIVVDTLISGGICDAHIVPISMSYEKLLDGNFVAEQMGKPKQMESFTSAVQAIWRTLHSNFGTVRVDFCQPFSLKEFLLAAEYSYTLPVKYLHPCIPQLNNCYYSNNKEEKSRRRSEYGTEIVTEDHRHVIKDLADYIVYDAFNINALMSTNVLAFLMTTKHRKGATFNQLVSSLKWLRDEIEKRSKVVGFTGDSAELIKRATNLLGKNLICVETIQMEWSSGNADNNMKITFYKPKMTLPEILELQYYANSVLPVFLLESVVVNAACAVLSEEQDKSFSSNKKTLLRGQIIKQSLELCSLLQYEFIFSPPGTSLCTVLSATIDDLIGSGLLQIEEESVDDKKQDFDSFIMMNVITNGLHQEALAEKELRMNQTLMMCPCDDHSSMLPFLKCILSPLIESYWLVSCTLAQLIDSEMDEKAFIQEVKKAGQKKINIGQIFYEESLGLDAVKNALKLFESWRIVKTQNHGVQKTFALYPIYNNTKSLSDVISRIEKYK